MRSALIPILCLPRLFLLPKSVITALCLGVLSSASLWGQNLNFTPDKPDGPAKIQSALWELAIPGAAKLTHDVQDTVVVILVPHLGQASASIDTSSLAALGGRVLAQSKSLMRILVPASSLLAVAEMPGVRFVRRPHRPHSQATISEGASRIGALANHSAGVKGQGVKVAIIDGGFKGANKLAGDMPTRSRLRGHDFTGEGIYAGESAHGTACAEIIHDVAPEAELYLYKTGDMVDFENAKDRAVRDGIDVISHSGGFLIDGFGDGQGFSCDIVNDAADKGIFWVNAAGNSAQSHYEGFWSDRDSNGWHNFDGEDEVLPFEAEEGEEIIIFLTWNDWPDSRQNYDLYLFMDSSDGLEEVAKSTDRQNISGGEPVESIKYKVDRSGEYEIAVRSEEARPRRLKIWSYNLDFEKYAVAESSIGSPADARGAMSVGAIYHRNWSTGRIEEYSSRGPTTDGRIKPDLVAPTGVSTVSYGSDGYSGTSAAAPHVAGAAALIKSANPSYSRTQLWNALVAATVDIGPRGRDNDSGYGKLVLPVMRVSANTSPRISRISPQTGRTNTVVTVSGSNFGSSQGSSTVRIGSVVIPSSWLDSWSNTQIRFRIPVNTPPGNLTVRTSQGTSNSIRLQITSPYLTRISPMRAKTGDRLTLTGGNFGTRRGSGYVLFSSNVRPSAADYVSWSNSRIVVKVPVRARSGNVQVVSANGRSGTKRLQIESRSPQITSVSPRRAQYNQVVTVTGINFGSSQGSSTIRIGSVVIPSSWLDSWSNTTISFRVPTNMRSGNVVVRTAKGTSNAILLEIISPYLGSVSPTRVKPGDRLTLTGANFRSSRGGSYVRFAPNVRPASGDYVVWSDRRIVVEVPAEAQSGDVKVAVIGAGASGPKRITVEGDAGEVVESLPSRGLFGYSPPAVTKNPKSFKFGFGGASRDLACYFSVKEISDGEIDIFLNEQPYADIPASEDWAGWYLVLDRADLRSGTNIIEFRNMFNQNRTSGFARWQLKDVEVGAPPSAKPVAGTRILAEVPDSLASGLGDPFPSPFNAEVTIPFALAEAGLVRLAVYNLLGQQIRVLADGWLAAGAHRVRWNGRTDAGVEAASGVYWVVLQVSDAVQTAKLALIR